MAQSGSDNAANYVAAVSSAGAITYVETAYAKVHDFPVVSLINASGKAVQPTSLNVATALEKAILHADLTQDLTNVYTNPLPNAYPLSAYSYFVTPCSPSLGNAQKPPAACAADEGELRRLPARRGRPWAHSSPMWPVPASRTWPIWAIHRFHPTWCRRTSTPSAGSTGGWSRPRCRQPPARTPTSTARPPCPGSRAVVGQAAGTPGSTGSVAATIGTTAGGGAGSTAGGAGAGVGAGASGASGSGGAGGSSGSSGSAGTGSDGGGTAAAAALAHNAAPFGSRCPSKFLCADALVAATKGVGGLPWPMLSSWIVVALAIVAVPPIVAYWRRRRSPPALDGVEAEGPGDGENR